MIAPVPAYSRAYRGYFLALTGLISAFAIIDRVALLTVGQAIKTDLGISDFQFGLVSGLAFAAVYTLVGIPLARLADTSNRVRLIAWSVGIWSVFAMLSGFARNFVQLMLCRVVIGIGEAGVQPPSVAIVSDLYPAHRRGTALALLSIGLPVGTLVGAVTAGYLADTYSWRAVFIFLGVPGVLLAILAALTLRDPPRGLSDGVIADAAVKPPPVWQVLRLLARRPAFRHIVLGLALTYFAAAGIGSFLPQYFSRTFALGFGETGLMFGLVGAASNLVGNVSGGVLVDWIGRRDSRWYAWLPGGGILLSAPFYIAAFSIGNPVLATATLVVAGMILFLHYAPAQAVLQNMVAPQMRGTAAFIFFFIVSMLGYGIGPTLLGLLSDWFAASAFGAGDFAGLCNGTPAAGTAAACAQASASGIRTAMIVMSGLFVWGGAHFLLAARHLRADLAPLGAEPAKI